MQEKPARIAAAVVALIYIGIQTFQWYVFEQFPAPSSPREELMQGHHPLHVARSWVMLFAMFGLMYLYYVVCSLAARINRFWARFAFLGFFIFLSLEFTLRSIELFYIQQQLPEMALKSSEQALPGIIDKMQTFQSIQSSLYFPLIFGAQIGYVTLFFLFARGGKINRIIRVVMAINFLRSLWRLLMSYAGLTWLQQGNWYDKLYLPLVVVQFGLMAFWLFKVKDTGNQA